MRLNEGRKNDKNKFMDFMGGRGCIGKLPRRSTRLENNIKTDSEVGRQKELA
jgi:hypothetical protein